MACLKLKHVDFCSPLINVWKILSYSLFVVVCALLSVELLDLSEQQQEVEVLEQHYSKLKRLQKQVQQGGKAVSQEEQKVLDAMQVQGGAVAKLRPPILLRLEEAWNPRMALLSLSIEQAGKQLRVEGVSMDLREVYQFIARLNSQPSIQARLLRHAIKPGDSKTIIFSIQMDQQ